MTQGMTRTCSEYRAASKLLPTKPVVIIITAVTIFYINYDLCSFHSCSACFAKVPVAYRLHPGTQCHKNYGQRCVDNAICMEGSLVNKCQCLSQFYISYDGSSCEPYEIGQVGSSCSVDQQCPPTTFCSADYGVCVCLNGFSPQWSDCSYCYEANDGDETLDNCIDNLDCSLNYEDIPRSFQCVNITCGYGKCGCPEGFAIDSVVQRTCKAVSTQAGSVCFDTSDCPDPATTLCTVPPGICSCIPPNVADVNGQCRPPGTIGDACKQTAQCARNENCLNAHSKLCDGIGSCACNAGYAPKNSNSSNSTCLLNVDLFGNPCTTGTSVCTAPHTACSGNQRKCVCSNSNFVARSDFTGCVYKTAPQQCDVQTQIAKPFDKGFDCFDRQVGDACSSDGDCANLVNANCEATNSTCQCNIGFVTVKYYKNSKGDMSNICIEPSSIALLPDEGSACNVTAGWPCSTSSMLTLLVCTACNRVSDISVCTDFQGG